jgi:hypothetical protein
MKSIDEINEGHMAPLPTPQPVVLSPKLMGLLERLVVAAERQALAADRQIAVHEESRREYELHRKDRRRHILARDDDPPERAARLQAKADALHDAIDELNRKYGQRSE